MVEITKICPGAVFAVVIYNKCNPPSVIYNVRYSIVFESSGVSGHFSMDNEVKRSSRLPNLSGRYLDTCRVKFKNGSTRTSGVPLLEY